MDSYLNIAEEVLRIVKRPLSALQILRAAYERNLAPSHLTGRTQHKTLGARLSEDILHLRDNSRFYRTAPGRFLLRELADDPSIPEELRRPIIARRRRRQLAHKRSLAFDRNAIENMLVNTNSIASSAIFDLIAHGRYHYTTGAPERADDDVVVWTFMVVVKSGHVLSYRQGHYREDRDTFMHRRSVGFYTPIADEDLSFFDRVDHGIVSSGVRALAIDLDLHDRHIWPILEQSSCLRTFLYPEDCETNNLLAVVSIVCPDWLDPTSKRLAINNLEWLDLRTPLNNQDDFDPWSRMVISEARQLVVEGNDRTTRL